MRPLAPPLALLLLLAPPLAAGQSFYDPAAEVRDGAWVHLHFEYEGGAAGSAEGAHDPWAAREQVAYRASWSAPAVLLGDPSAPGTLRGAYMGEWNATASRAYVWDFDGGSQNKRHEEWTCQGAWSGHAGGGVVGRLEGDRLRLAIGHWVHSGTEPNGCSWWREDTRSDGVHRDSGTQAFSRKLPLQGSMENDSYDQEVEVIVPLEGRASFRSSFSAAVPAPEGSPEWMYCGLTRDDWVTGSCRAEGTLTVRVWVDPCMAIKRRLAEFVVALSQVPPPPQGADEAGVAAWAAGVQPQIAAVLGAARAHMLLCGEDLPVDPWDAIVRAQRMHRDALLAIAREGGLSPEGTSTLLGVERSLQLMGVDDGIDYGDVDFGAAAPPEGSLEVRVHSPVSLHAWSEDGGHVGWNATTNASEATIPGARYEGAPGGEQRIVLPAGFYRITVDELAAGRYLLDVRVNGSGSEANESWLVPSLPGRTTATHYAVVSQDGALALQTFPVRRESADAAADAGPAATPAPDDGGDGGGGDDGEARGVPAPGALGAALAAVGAAVATRRARR